jgi:hypothetical protein
VIRGVGPRYPDERTSTAGPASSGAAALMTAIRLVADRSAIILAEICDLFRGKSTGRANHF